MLRKIQTRLNSEQGFTLIELLVVIIILGILTAIAVPSYLSFRGNAQDAAAKANVRSAIPAAESFYQDSNGGSGSYLWAAANATTGAAAGDPMDNTALAFEAPGISPDVTAVVSTAGQGYCLQDTAGGASHSYYYIGGTNDWTTNTGVQATISKGDCSVVSG
jgi:type IV pilus assembly protein PilA